MVQMKEQNKTPENELNKREISNNLLDAQFKTLVISMLQELIGYFNSIKKTQAEKKDALSKIKKNLQGTNSGGDEAENQINDLEHKEGKSIQSEQQEEKRIQKKNEGRLRNLSTFLNIPTFRSYECQKEKRKNKKLKTNLKK